MKYVHMNTYVVSYFFVSYGLLIKCHFKCSVLYIYNLFFRFAKVLIECVRDITLNEPFRGQVRKEDIREFEKDKIEMYKSFRPGDIILARVLSMGEASSGYLLSTSENELGVVIAKSEHTGVKMIPVSWTEMQCPKSYNKEFRKIAKVVPENLGESQENK